MVSLVTGVLSGLQRMGWDFNLTAVVADHGAIMIGGFIGTLITLEKIIPLKRTALYILPILSGSSVFLFFIDQPWLSVFCLILSSAGLCMVFLIYLLRERSLVYAIMLAGALAWATGNVLLLTNGFYPVSLPWWMAFVLLVIASERLELMKFLPVSLNQKRFFVGMLALFTVTCALTFHGIGSYLAAFSLIAIALWLMRFDVVGLNLKKQQLTRYTGVALLTGYVSLSMCGIFILLASHKPLGYDILVHTFFLGFVLSMIFAHGPIILPGVLGISIKPYHTTLYLWLTLLHGSWVVRVFADFTLDMVLRKYTGMASGIAIAGYFITLIFIIIRSVGRAKTV